jgi:hypothetical protein
VKADMEVRAGAVSKSLRGSAGTLKAELSDAATEALDRVKQAGSDVVAAVQDSLQDSAPGRAPP